MLSWKRAVELEREREENFKDVIMQAGDTHVEQPRYYPHNDSTHCCVSIDTILSLIL